VCRAVGWKVAGENKRGGESGAPYKNPKDRCGGQFVEKPRALRLPSQSCSLCDRRRRHHSFRPSCHIRQSSSSFTVDPIKLYYHYPQQCRDWLQSYSRWRSRPRQWRLNGPKPARSKPVSEISKWCSKCFRTVQRRK